jgi:hypothetical protein
MTYTNRIQELLLSGAEISYRSLEAVECINHPNKPLKQAITRLKQAGLSIDADGYPRINPNTGKDYKVWYIKRGIK